MEQLIEIAYSDYSVSGYAKSLFFQITGSYLSTEFPELEAMMADAEAQAMEKEAITIENSDSSLRIFPNPAADQLEILSSDDVNMTEVQLTDLQGKAIFHEAVNKNSVTLDLQNVGIGIYLLQIMDEHGHITIEKIIVNK